MIKQIFKAAVFAGLMASTQALMAQQSPAVEKVDISKLDRSMTIHKAKPRTFKNKAEFQKHRKQTRNATVSPHANKHRHRDAITSKQSRHMHGERYPYRYNRNRYYDDFFGYDDMPDRFAPHGRAHRDFKRGWVLAYRYDRADFYDRDGFHYGYFNRYGYYFEGEFYRYDHYYTYRDRVRGRGLFDHYFYRPAQWRYYGFCR